MQNSLRAPRIPSNKAEIARWKRLIVVLEQCPLEVDKVGDFDPVLLNVGEHHRFLTAKGKNSAAYRPDIVHQCLVSLQESPLNLAGRLQVYIRTTENQLIAVSPHFRVPISYQSFASCIVDLFAKHKLRAALRALPLLRLIHCDVAQHIPTGAPVFVASVDGDLCDVERLAAASQADLPAGAPPSAFISSMVGTAVYRMPEATSVKRGGGRPLAAVSAQSFLSTVEGKAARTSAGDTQKAKNQSTAPGKRDRSASASRAVAEIDASAAAAATSAATPPPSKKPGASVQIPATLTPPPLPYPSPVASQRAVVLVIGGFAHGELTASTVPYGHQPHVCFAPTSLSAAACCVMATAAFERVWLGDGLQ